MNYIDRVLARLQGGDKAKVAKVQTQTIKYVKTQIELSEREIKKHNEDLEEAKETCNELIETPDIEDIKTNEDARNYASTYITEINIVMNTVDSLKEKIEEEQAQIDRYKEILKELE